MEGEWKATGGRMECDGWIGNGWLALVEWGMAEWERGTWPDLEITFVLPHAPHHRHHRHSASPAPLSRPSGLLS